MTPERKIEIDECAKQIHAKAEEYQMSHATFACDYLLRELLQVEKKEMSDEAEEYLYLAMKGENSALNRKRYERQRERLREFEKRWNSCRVYVEYFRPTYDEAARTLRLESHLLMELPEALSKQCLPIDGQYNKDAIHKLRGIIAHEIGHLMLHLDHIDKGTRGSEALTEAQDQEANYFKKILIGLRNKRRQQLLKQDVYIHIA